MNKKRVLMYVHYYYPDVASTAQIYTDLCRGLKDKFDITVICTVPSYTGNIDEKYIKKKYFFENDNGIKVIRVRVPNFSKTNKFSRVKNIFTYFVRSMFATLKADKPDIVFTASQPPILGGVLGVWGKICTKGKLVYNIQDFNPEQTMAVGYMGNKITHRLMMTVDKFSCKRTDVVITVGRDMRETLKKRFNNKNVPNNIVINNWIDEKEVYPLNKDNDKVVAFRKKYGLEGKFVIMYSGNIGLYYDLQNILKIFAKYKDNKDVVFAFVGDGAIKNELIEFAEKNNLGNVRFIPYQNKEDLIYSLNSADVQLVTNAKGIKGVSVPSKIYGVMSANIPVIGILEEGSEAWQIISDSNCGILAKTGDYSEIESVCDKVINEKYDFVSNHLTGRNYLIERYTKDKSLKQYEDAILALLER
ncbi:MAG: glycosyltransferase family 4 protein [Lachnospirales bacterium]